MKKSHISLFGILSLQLLFSQSAYSIIFNDTADSNHNMETAPTGAYSNSGWQHLGLFGNFLGTSIAPHYFITAKHLGKASTTFVSKSFFNGTGSDITYNIDTSANGGSGYWNIAGTDLNIFKITGTFANYASLYSGSDETNKELVVMGRGTQRGNAVIVNNTTKGWKWGASDHKTRWGRNKVSGIVNGGPNLGHLLRVEFNDITGQDEAHLSNGDSGGAVFIQEGGTWKLAGINYAVDSKWDTNNTTGDGSDFNAALTDKGGLYQGNDTNGWTFNSDTFLDKPSNFYSTRISTNIDAINLIIVPVPEPTSTLLLASGSLLLILRRKRA